MVKTTLNTLHHCVYSTQYHLVIATKYRRKALNEEMLSRFSGLAAERCEAWEGRLIECNGEADHIHMLFTIPPKYALSNFVNALKTGTSRRLRNEFTRHLAKFYRKPILWSRSYCVITCGDAPLEIIKQYIQSQERPA